MNPNLCCGSCRFFDIATTDCRIKPPVINRNDGQGGWPKVECDCWCGSHSTLYPCNDSSCPYCNGPLGAGTLYGHFELTATIGKFKGRKTVVVECYSCGAKFRGSYNGPEEVPCE